MAMKISLIAVGGELTDGLHKEYETYITRLQRWSNFSFRAVANLKRKDSASAKAEEAHKILQLLSESAWVVLLDERGTEWSSEEFSAKLETWRSIRPEVTFVIGGAYGVDDMVRRRADTVWSLSKLVFPHEIARLLVAEQLYRALAIANGHPYHHR